MARQGVYLIEGVRLLSPAHKLHFSAFGRYYFAMHDSREYDMTNEMQDIFQDVKRAQLSESERGIMRNELRYFMSENPAQAPFSVRAADYFANIFSARPYMAYHPLSAALALALVFGVSTSYAAERALPGDILYAVKIGINEPVQGAFAVSGSAKTQWNTELIERRLEEAESLAAAGKLTPEIRTEIQTKLEQTSIAFNKSVEELESSDDSAAIAAAHSEYEASLQGHERVLTALSDIVPAAREDVGPLLASVRAKALSARSARAHAELAVSTTNNTSVRVAALDTKRSADSRVNEVRSKAAVSLNVAPPTAAMEADSSANVAQEAIAMGNELLEEGKYGDAFGTFQMAIRTAEAAKVQLEAEMRLKTSFAAAKAPANPEAATMMMFSATTTATTTDEIVEEEDTDR